MRYLLVAIISSAVTAAVILGPSFAADTHLQAKGRTITLRPHDEILVGAPINWHCSYGVYADGSPNGFFCEPSDWHLTQNDNPVVALYPNAATVATQTQPTYTSATKRYTAQFRKSEWTP